MNQIIVDVGISQNRVALVENSELVELYIEEEENKRVTGNIYKGRVVNVLPGMQAAFVDIGLEKNAFLYVKDAIPKEILEDNKINLKDISIKDVVKSGQEIIVQVVKEPFNTKGARVTTHITLPGRQLVLMPYTNYIGVSRRIEKEEERERLRQLVEKHKPENMGVIIRTASEGIGEDEFKEDISYLLKLLKKVDLEKKLGFAPRIIYKDLNLIQRTVRDLLTNDMDELIINKDTEYKSVLELVKLVSPESISKIKYFNESHDIFGYFGIETMINSALDKNVWLKSGGYIVIDETEALTSIDVNTGKYVGSINLEETVLKTNLEAATEIAKQLKLRNIGGIIIIDFIDMRKQKNVEIVLKSLENELKKDRTKSNILGMTQLGLVEMTRKKVRSRLTAKLLRRCPCCNGNGKVSSEDAVLSKMDKEVNRTKLHTSAEAMILEVNGSIYDYIENRKSDYLKSLKDIYEIDIYLRKNNNVHFNDVKVARIGKKEYIKDQYYE